MTIKNWKKTFDNGHDITYKKKNTNIRLFINEMILGIEWSVSISNFGFKNKIYRNRIIGSNKAKTQAIKFAKAYMRKH